MRQNMICTTTIESATRASLHLYSGNRYKISRTHPHSRYTCSKFPFDWSRSKVTSQEEQSSYSSMILILSGVFSPKFICVTLRVFFIHPLSFLVIGQEIWALRMTTIILLRPISLSVTGIFMKIHTWDPTHIPCTCSELSCNRRSKGTSHEDQNTPPYLATGGRNLHENSYLRPHAHSLYMLWV